MTYAELEIAQGGDASAVYLAAVEGRLTGAEKDKAFEALRVYCAQDTLATVRLLDSQFKTVKEKEPVI